MCIQRDFYVDDILTGADTFSKLNLFAIKWFNCVKWFNDWICFKLSKWASNCPELLSHVNSRDDQLVTIRNEAHSSILGIRWNQSQKTFHFSCMLDLNCNILSQYYLRSPDYSILLVFSAPSSLSLSSFYKNCDNLVLIGTNPCLSMFVLDGQNLDLNYLN